MRILLIKVALVLFYLAFMELFCSKENVFLGDAVVAVVQQSSSEGYMPIGSPACRQDLSNNGVS